MATKARKSAHATSRKVNSLPEGGSSAASAYCVYSWVSLGATVYFSLNRPLVNLVYKSVDFWFHPPGVRRIFLLYLNCTDYSFICR